MIEEQEAKGGKKGTVLKMIKDCFTRKNFFHDCVERAVELHTSINDFIEEGCDHCINYQGCPDHNRHEKRYARGTEPSILRNKVLSGAWNILAQYHELYQGKDNR
jgi:hypothetical protein